MLGQIFVDERVVAVEEFQDTAVLAEDVGEDHLRLALHQAAERADLGVRLPRESVLAENRSWPGSGSARSRAPRATAR